MPPTITTTWRGGNPADAEKEELAMMPPRVNVPLLAQGAQVWNSIIPNMIQAVLTKQRTPLRGTAEAETNIKDLLG